MHVCFFISFSSVFLLSSLISAFQNIFSLLCFLSPALIFAYFFSSSSESPLFLRHFYCSSTRTYTKFCIWDPITLCNNPCQRIIRKWFFRKGYSMYRIHGQDKISSPYVSQGRKNWECFVLREDNCCINFQDVRGGLAVSREKLLFRWRL